MAFLVLEDETGRLPVAVPPPLAGELYRRIRRARVVLITGRVERVRWYRSLLAQDLRAITYMAQTAEGATVEASALTQGLLPI
jgi:hypothetical protein